MNFADIRSRLADLEGRAYWRSLDELADTPEFQDYVGREFPAQASEFNDPKGRRQFLKLMGASLALAGVGACTRQPPEKIVPYVRQPEEIIPGRPLFFATAMPLGGFGLPLLAENHMGRPTKIEGNPDHPASLGGTDIFSQASVLGLYDPDRSRTILGRGEFKTWSAFVGALTGAMNAQRAMKGASLRLLTEPITSPALLDQIQTLLSAYPDAKWYQWDPVFGAVQGGAPSATPLYRFNKADVVVALDADFLNAGPGAVRYAKDFSSRRRIDTPEDQQTRLYAIEPVPTITGSKAEHRIALKSRDVHTFASRLAAALGIAGAPAGSLGTAVPANFIPALVRDLQAHRGKSLVVAGDRQPAAVHALARAMNDALGNTGSTVMYTAPLTGAAGAFTDLVGEMHAGKVDALVILDANPCFTAPADLKFTAALEKVGLRVHLGLYADETAEHCHWHVPAAHYLESWGDVRAFDGTVSMLQPLIAPLYDGKSAIEIVAAMNGQPAATGFELVKAYWVNAFAGRTTPAWTLRDRDGKPFANPENFWRHALHDGFVPSTSLLADGAVVPPADKATGSFALGADTSTTTSDFEIVFRPDPTILDGRFANNGWLQELPKPLAKVTWDNVAYVSFNTAEKLHLDAIRVGNRGQEVLEITYKGQRLRMPVWIMPGTADDVVAVHFGYGRRKSGRVGQGIGVDVYPIRTSKALWFDGGATVVNTGETYEVSATQNHFAMEGRDPVRVVNAVEYRANPKSVEKLGPERPPKTLSMYPVHEYNGYKWGMSIDLNACTGCSVCMVACVAENNIPVVGKEQVKKTREMHWIRVDTYREGADPDTAKTYHQPVPCQQCENAPCEAVCPVAATVHSDEGLNDMVYNRCVGTRYCSNNCPYKVRRFNFLLYQDFTTPELEPLRNPDVTVRSRGVMEKCTYCVQRISHARIDAKTKGETIADDAIQTACQQACPTDAIVFGNLNDPAAKVTKLKAQERNYGLLEDLGTRPRTSYLAVVRNPNPELEPKKA